MTLKPSSAKNKGRQGEHEVARMLQGKRAPLSGIIPGTGDVLPGELFKDWVIEVKRRAKLPHLLSNALIQAAAAKGKGDLRNPMVWFREDNGQWMVCVWGTDFIEWALALAEVGNGAAIKAHVRQIKKELQLLEEKL